METVLAKLLIVTVLAPILPWVCGVRTPLARGPLFVAMLRRLVLWQLFWLYACCGGFAFWLGSTFVSARPFSLIALFASIVVGAAVGWGWAHFRLLKAQYTPAGPDPSTPPERLFPSDRLAQAMHECRSQPLPFWLDSAIVWGSMCLGAAFAAVSG